METAPGVRYFLLLLVWSNLHLDHLGKMRLQLPREGIPLTRRLRADLMADTDREYRIDSYYIPAKHLNLIGNHDSNHGWGARLRFIY